MSTVPVPGSTDPRTEGADRRPTFYVRDGYTLTCPECLRVFDHIPTDWLDGHIGEHVGCPECGLSSRIPVDDDGTGS